MLSLNTMILETLTMQFMNAMVINTKDSDCEFNFHYQIEEVVILIAVEDFLVEVEEAQEEEAEVVVHPEDQIIVCWSLVYPLLEVGKILKTTCGKPVRLYTQTFSEMELVL